MFWKKKWSKNPGCFERHLQRRDGNVLFPLERRNVSKEEIGQARRMDEKDQDNFLHDTVDFMNELNDSDELNPIQSAFDKLKKVQEFLEKAASIGGDLEKYILMLEKLEVSYTEFLNEAVPDGKDLIDQGQALSSQNRMPFFAHLKRKDSPILQDEQVPTLLSEDLDTIAVVGLLSRSFPNFKPAESDIKKKLDEAIRERFSRDRARDILNAWNSIEQEND